MHKAYMQRALRGSRNARRGDRGDVRPGCGRSSRDECAVGDVERGRAVLLGDLQLQGLKGESAKDEKGRQFNCPHCGAPVQVQLATTKSLTCPSCASLINLDSGVVTLSNPLDLTGYAEPLYVVHRIEDMSLVSDVEISGRLTLARPLSHAYDAADTYVSSALIIGDLWARYTGLFDQKSWTNVWSDYLIGDQSTAQYNDTVYPILVTNRGALQERWAVIFTSSSVGRKGRAYWGAYATSKFANEGLMQVLADEMDGICPGRANSINPGATRMPSASAASNTCPDERPPGISTHSIRRSSWRCLLPELRSLAEPTARLISRFRFYSPLIARSLLPVQTLRR